MYKCIHTYNTCIYNKNRYTNASVPPLHTTYPHHRGGGRTYLSARLLYFVIPSYILFPLPHNIPPPQGGRESLSFSMLTIFCHHLLHLVPPSTQHTPTKGGEGGTMTIGGGRGGWRGWRIYTVICISLHQIL